MHEQARLRRIALGQPRLVEERRAHGAAGIGHLRLDQGPHAAATDRARCDRTHNDGHRGLLSGTQRRDRARLAALAGQVLEQIPDGRTPSAAAPAAMLPVGDLQRRLQARGTGPAQRRAQQLRAVKLLTPSRTACRDIGPPAAAASIRAQGTSRTIVTRHRGHRPSAPRGGTPPPAATSTLELAAIAQLELDARRGRSPYRAYGAPAPASTLISSRAVGERSSTAAACRAPRPRRPPRRRRSRPRRRA